MDYKNIMEDLKNFDKVSKEFARDIMSEIINNSGTFGEAKDNFDKLKKSITFGTRKYSNLFILIEEVLNQIIDGVDLYADEVYVEDKEVVTINTIGQNIKQAREKLSIKQSQLSKLLGIPQATMSRYENDLRNPDYKTLINICLALKTTPNDLLNFKEEINERIENI